VESIIDKFNKKFGDNSLPTMTHEKILEYLGMTLDCITTAKVKISIYKYMHKLLAEYSLDMNEVAKTMAAVYLFNMNPNVKKYPEDNSVGVIDITFKLHSHFYVLEHRNLTKRKKRY